jgi:NTE family protein
MKRVNVRPRIGLALGGGGARGYAHLGVLKILLGADIPIDVIAGTSMGAVVGAAYAAGYEIEEMENMVLQMGWRQMFKLADPSLPRQGLIIGNRLEKYFNILARGKDFNQLEKELVVVATDVISGEEVRINSGPVASALRASTSLPGIFYPVKAGSHLLVDGSISTPVPLAAAQEAGSDVVVAVDVSSQVDRADILIRARKWCEEIASKKGRQMIWAESLRRWLDSSMPASIKIIDRSLELNEQYIGVLKQKEFLPKNYILLKPAVENTRWYEFHKAEECIRAGEAAGRQVVDQIKTLVKEDFPTPTSNGLPFG